MQAALRFLGSSVVVAILFAAVNVPAINNSNVTFSGVTTNFNGILTWPWDDTGTNNTLSIINGAVVIDTSHWFGGINAQANRNFVIISDSGSLWSNDVVNSFVGRQGSGNQLLVTNGGAWVSANALIGSLTASASNNSVLVTGNGSLFRTTSDINMGGGGAGNLFTVTDQGRVSAVGITIGSGAVGNQMVVSNGGRVFNTGNFILSENTTASTNNQVTVTGTGSVLSNSSNLLIGRWGPSNRMVVSDGGLVINGVGIVGGVFFAAGSNNSVLVTGNNSVWSNSSSLSIGSIGGGNQLTIANTGKVYAASLTIGSSTGAGNLVAITNGGRYIGGGGITLGESGFPASSNNLLRVADADSELVTVTITTGRGSANNQVMVENGGRVVSTGISRIGVEVAASNNVVTVTGVGSLWSNTSSIVVGSAGSANVLLITNRGKVFASDVTLGESTGVGNGIRIEDEGELTVSGGITLAPNGQPLATNNLIRVSGTGSKITAGGITVGAGAAGNQLIIENGASVTNGGITRIGNQAAASNCSVIVTGSGSVWSAASIVAGNVGNGNRLVVTDNGAVFASDVTAGETTGTGNSVLVQNGGLLQSTFLLAGAGNSISNIGGIYQFTTPTPVITAGRVFINNGTVSFRAINNAPSAALANLTYQGNNTLRLNNATNANVAGYTFESADITGNPSNYRKLALINNSRWQSDSLTIGTNGAVSADAGSMVALTGHFTIRRASNPSGDFDLASSTVHFSGGGIHTNAITGQDLGNNGTLGFPNGFTAQNFSYGKLTLGSTNDRIQFVMGDGGLSNALYVTSLDLGGFTNLYPSVSNMVTSLLFAPSSINVYYLLSGPGDGYLNNQTYQLASSPGGGIGGFLMPAVPEPSTLALLAFGMVVWLRRRP